MLEILTLMEKIERVSRSIESSFVAYPGLWAVLNNDGSIENITEGSNAKVNKLVIGSKSSSVYESHDTAVGRITTMESHGTRCKVNSGGFYGKVNQGDRLVVSSFANSLGKLVSVEETAETGDHEIVARCEEVDPNGDWIVFRTMSPTIVSL